MAHAVSAAAVTTRRIINSGDAGTCQRASDYAPLARLPRGPMLAFIDSGPFILMESGHAVLAAPYHRNQAGNNAMLDMFLAAPDDAKAKLAAHGIDTVAFCPGAPERYDYAAGAPAGLAAALGRGDEPGFLERIPRQRSRRLSRPAVRSPSLSRGGLSEFARHPLPASGEREFPMTDL